ncbi:MAG: lactococcin 972 family bacteriocin [Oscillospiraceae bacterium]|jgi:hypothetical protein|nr:lactococcin 972 family bacteriocin [Oscillospiraceae bacterium]
MNNFFKKSKIIGCLFLLLSVPFISQDVWAGHQRIGSNALWDYGSYIGFGKHSFSHFFSSVSEHQSTASISGRTNFSGRVPAGKTSYADQGFGFLLDPALAYYSF